MLVVDPKKRIDWEELFKHEINFFLEEKIKKDLEETMNAEEVQMSMSRFYIKVFEMIFRLYFL
jgi:serine/threonine-protein kinase ULK/ATG1